MYRRVIALTLSIYLVVVAVRVKAILVAEAKVTHSAVAGAPAIQIIPVTAFVITLLFTRSVPQIASKALTGAVSAVPPVIGALAVVAFRVASPIFSCFEAACAAVAVAFIMFAVVIVTFTIAFAIAQHEIVATSSAYCIFHGAVLVIIIAIVRLAFSVAFAVCKKGIGAAGTAF